MAGRGPAPKAEDDRRRRPRPARGEWRELEPIDRRKPFLPNLPRKRPDGEDWLQETRDCWAGYQLDPATRTYTSGDLAAARRLALLTDEMFRGGKVVAEVRHLETLLGLNPKGKRDLRFRVVGIGESAPPEPRGQLVGIDGGKVTARDQILGATSRRPPQQPDEPADD